MTEVGRESRRDGEAGEERLVNIPRDEEVRPTSWFPHPIWDEGARGEDGQQARHDAFRLPRAAISASRARASHLPGRA